MPVKRATPRHPSRPQRAPDLEPAEIATRLDSAAIHLLRLLRREDDASGISAPLLSALSVLVFGGPRTLGELAAAEQVRPATMSRAVDALATAGLAERASDPSDGRVARIRATPAGRRMLEAGRRRRVASLTSRLDGLTAADRRTLETAIGILERVIGETPG